MSEEDIKAEVARLKEENERLKARQRRAVSLKVSEKGPFRLRPRSLSSDALQRAVDEASRHGRRHPGVPQRERQPPEIEVVIADGCWLFISQRLRGIYSCDPQSRHRGSNERYRGEHQDDREDGGEVVDFYAIDHAAHRAQDSRAKDQSQEEAQHRGARA